MVLPNWKAIPVRTKRSRKRLHNLIAPEFNLDRWTELPNPIKRSKKKLAANTVYCEFLHIHFSFTGMLRLTSCSSYPAVRPAAHVAPQRML